MPLEGTSKMELEVEIKKNINMLACNNVVDLIAKCRIVYWNHVEEDARKL
jgi:hypothetical protein